MDVIAEVRFGCYRFDDVLRHVFRIRRSEPHTHIRHALGHLAEQFGERRPVLRPSAVRQQSVGVDVLPQQRDLFEALVVQVVYLLQDAFHIARAFTATGEGHDAIMAEVVAAAHDAHEAGHPVAADALRYDITVGLGGRQLDVHRIHAVLALCNHVGQVEVGVRAAYQVGVVILYKIVPHTLCHASQYAQYQSAAFLLLGMQGFQPVVDLVLRILAYRTGVEEDGVGLLLILAYVVAGHLHDGGHDLGISHVHLASVCLNI